MLISDYISKNDEETFCSNCCEICGYQCVVYRKAIMERDKQETNETVKGE